MGNGFSHLKVMIKLRRLISHSKILKVRDQGISIFHYYLSAIWQDYIRLIKLHKGLPLKTYHLLGLASLLLSLATIMVTGETILIQLSSSKSDESSNPLALDFRKNLHELDRPDLHLTEILQTFFWKNPFLTNLLLNRFCTFEKRYRFEGIFESDHIDWDFWREEPMSARS